MARKRIPTGLSGILALDKPLGVTSHDVVNTVRKLTGERRVGHAGTLDPLASGLLMVCVGPATRLADYLMAGQKTYEVRVCFGTATTTDDAEGEVLITTAPPERLHDETFVREQIDAFLGEIQQAPPVYSAIKQGGKKAYEAARAGNDLTLEPRTVHLYDAELLGTGEDYLDIRLVVSKGFYVRSFARDLGKQMGSSAHVGALRRTASGLIDVGSAASLEELEAARETGRLPFIDAVFALGLPVFELDDAEAQRVAHGMTLTLQGGLRGSLARFDSLVSVVHANRLLALYECAGKTGLATPKVVIPGGVSRSETTVSC